MPDEHWPDHNAMRGQTIIWLVHSAGQLDDDVVAFWERTDADAWATANPHRLPVLRAVDVQGARRRCRLCGEPVVLDDPSDEESWRHADDANDLGDHTADV